mgnify:CR=1 FL=1
MKNLEKLPVYIRAATYSYLGHGERYEQWTEAKEKRKNKMAMGGKRYSSIYEPIFTTLITNPEIIECPGDPYLYFVVLETATEIMLVFPGTRTTIQGLRDFNVDFQMKPKTTLLFGEAVQLHFGFLSRYLSQRDIIQNYLQKLDTSKHVTFVGHSLGASMAVMAAFDLTTRRRGFTSKCVTFGMPKFTCDTFHQIYTNSDIDVISVKKLNDPICNQHFVPFTCYQHTGQELFISENDDIWAKVLLGTALSLPLFPVGTSVIQFLYTVIVTLYGMTLTHGSRTYVNQIDSFIATSPGKNFKNNPKCTSDLCLFYRLKRTVQDAAVFLPIGLIVSISLIQFSIFPFTSLFTNTVILIGATLNEFGVKFASLKNFIVEKCKSLLLKNCILKKVYWKKISL